jgi:hypothetical protein
MFSKGFTASGNTTVSLVSTDFTVNTVDDGAAQEFGSFYLQATGAGSLTERKFQVFSYSTSWTIPSDVSAGDVAIVVDYKWIYAGGLPNFSEVIPSGFTNIFSANSLATYQKARLIVSYKSLVSGDIGATVNGMTNDSGGRCTKMLLIFEPQSAATYSVGDIFSTASTSTGGNGNLGATNTTVTYPGGHPILVIGAKSARNTSVSGSVATINTTSGSFTGTLLQENDNVYNLRTSYYLDNSA